MDKWADNLSIIQFSRDSLFSVGLDSALSVMELTFKWTAFDRSSLVVPGSSTFIRRACNRYVLLSSDMLAPPCALRREVARQPVRSPGIRRPNLAPPARTLADAEAIRPSAEKWSRLLRRQKSEGATVRSYPRPGLRTPTRVARLPPGMTAGQSGRIGAALHLWGLGCPVAQVAPGKSSNNRTAFRFLCNRGQTRVRNARGRRNRQEGPATFRPA